MRRLQGVNVHGSVHGGSAGTLPGVQSRSVFNRSGFGIPAGDADADRAGVAASACSPTFSSFPAHRRSATSAKILRQRHWRFHRIPPPNWTRLRAPPGAQSKEDNMPDKRIALAS